MAVSANNLSHSPIDHHKVTFFSPVLACRRTLIVIAHVSTRVIEQRVGYAIFALYSFQLLLGMFIRGVRTPSLFIAHRPPQNYLHAALGLAILAMAGYQVRL
jgi:hypothetical protein